MQPNNEFESSDPTPGIIREVEFSYLELPDIDALEQSIAANDQLNQPYGLSEPSINIYGTHEVQQNEYTFYRDRASFTAVFAAMSGSVGLTWSIIGKTLDVASSPTFFSHGAELIGKAGVISALGLFAVAGYNETRAQLAKIKQNNNN